MEGRDLGVRSLMGTAVFDLLVGDARPQSHCVVRELALYGNMMSPTSLPQS